MSWRGGIAGAERKSFWGGCTCFRARKRPPRTPMHWQLARGCRSGRKSCGMSRRERFSRCTAAVTVGLIEMSPPPRRDLLPRNGFLTTTSLIATRGCHNRCGFCYLATEGLTMPYQVRDVDQVVAEFRDDGQPYARVHRQ